MPLREKIRASEPVIGNWHSLGDPTAAELSAELGFDFVLLDIEHTTHSLETTTAMVRAVDAAATKTECVVRLPWNDPVTIKRVLDTGASGVMAPMIGSAGEAERLVHATRYPPDGMRGVGGARASRYGLDLAEYVQRANAEVITIAQIETREGLEDVEEIAAVDGIDALFVGPADLSANLGVFGEWESETFLDAIDRILAAGHAAGTPVSTLTIGTDAIERWLTYGYDFVMVGSDKTYLIEGSRASIDTFEATLATLDD